MKIKSGKAFIRDIKIDDEAAKRICPGVIVRNGGDGIEFEINDMHLYGIDEIREFSEFIKKVAKIRGYGD